MNQLPYMTYSVTTGKWDPDEFGNHRAVIEVAPGAKDDAVAVRIPWRRRDPHPEAKGVLLFSRKGTPVADYAPIDVCAAYGDFVFNPVDGAGRYYLYFMPYTGTIKKPYPQADYLPADQGETPWRAAHSGRGIGDFPAATVTALESIDEHNRFNEMELIATRHEIDSMPRGNGSAPFQIFPESRERPIRMFDAIPYRWAASGPGCDLAERARPGEYFAFQVGVYAEGADVSDLTIEFGDLISAGDGPETAIALPADRMTCVNTRGVGWDGKPFGKSVAVPRGAVQPLWCGIDLPQDIPPGDYALPVTVHGTGASRSCTVRLAVTGPAIPRRGDDDPWRLSRLRWLDSTLGTEDTVVPPYTPVRREGRRLYVLGREIELGENGLPGQITSTFTDDVQSADGPALELLARPVEFAVAVGPAPGAGRENGVSPTAGDRSGPPVPLVSEGLEFTDSGETYVCWRAASAAGPLRFDLTGRLEFDGTIDYTVEVNAPESAGVSEIALETLFRNQAAQLMTGLGRKGGALPDEFDWKWDAEYNQDAVWIGCVNGGIQLTMKDDSYSRPLNTNFYHLKPLVMPTSWANDGKGTVAMRRSDDGYRLSCRSGSRTMNSGETLRYDFRLAVTPFKPIDTRAHFTTRYFHAYRPLEEAQASGGNTLNIHHAQEINPYINYPFLNADILGRYISDAHDQDLKVKLYYTVRELTTRAPELFMLKSLGDEILVDGKGGGHAWLQEHFGDRYIAAWYSLAVRDTSVINGVLSRWHNFYVEGMNWLAENLAIDGVYIDDLGFGREIMKRVRRVLHRHRPDPMIDLHSANQYNERDGYASSANLYLEHFPYLDRLWFGEYFDYNEKPDYWLVEITGIPFGLMSEMLQDGGNLWRGMVFGMTGRMPRVETNVPLWKFWDAYGLADSKMIGFWSTACPVAAQHPEVYATVYSGAAATVISLASWADADVETSVSVDWNALGMEPASARVIVPEIKGVQADGGEIALVTTEASAAPDAHGAGDGADSGHNGAAGGTTGGRPGPGFPVKIEQGKGVLLVVERR